LLLGLLLGLLRVERRRRDGNENRGRKQDGANRE
jgi:hypothetical protein